MGAIQALLRVAPLLWVSRVKTGVKYIYFIPSSESSAYLKQIKGILYAVKKYRIFSLVTNTIFIFFHCSKQRLFRQFLGLISSRKDLECTVLV